MTENFGSTAGNWKDGLVPGTFGHNVVDPDTPRKDTTYPPRCCVYDFMLEIRWTTPGDHAEPHEEINFNWHIKCYCYSCDFIEEKSQYTRTSIGGSRVLDKWEYLSKGPCDCGPLAGTRTVPDITGGGDDEEIDANQDCCLCSCQGHFPSILPNPDDPDPPRRYDHEHFAGLLDQALGFGNDGTWSDEFWSQIRMFSDMFGEQSCHGGGCPDTGATGFGGDGPGTAGAGCSMGNMKKPTGWNYETDTPRNMGDLHCCTDQPFIDAV